MRPMITRRAALLGLVAAPAIVRLESLMPVRLFDANPTLNLETLQTLSLELDEFTVETLSLFYLGVVSKNELVVFAPPDQERTRLC